MNKPEPSGRNDSHEFDYSQVIERVFIGSDLCKGGVCLIHAEKFKMLGVSVEINLSDEENELPPKEIESYTWLPTVDGFAPSQGQLNIGTAVVNEAVRAGKNVYIHCKNGHGRSPTLVAAYLIRYKGYKTDQAINLVKEKRKEVHIEETQKRALEQYSSQWSK